MKLRFDQNEEDDINRWMVSYADLLTLLFAFFVVMYAISTVNMFKYKRLTGSMQNAFGSKTGAGQGAREYLGSNPEAGLKEGSAQGETDEPGFDVLNLESLIDKNMMTIRNYNRDWVEIEMRSNVVFKSGDADPTLKAIAALEQVAKELKKLPFRVIVEGYTDNVPISTVVYPSNWELSAARAAAVVRVLTNHGVDKNGITAVGFGEQFPIATNETPEGRELNRRVVIVVARHQNVARILNPWAEPPPELKQTKVISSPEHQNMRKLKAKEAQEAKKELKELIKETRKQELERERERLRETEAKKKRDLEAFKAKQPAESKPALRRIQPAPARSQPDGSATKPVDPQEEGGSIQPIAPESMTPRAE